MSHSYVSNLMHCTFSTKERFRFIEPELESRLWPYVGGIARENRIENRIKPLAIGGIADHVHALLWLPATMSFAKAVQLIKGGSSKWVHDAFPKYQQFGWQEDTALSVSAPLKWKRPLPIFRSRRSISAGKPFQRSSGNYSSDMASNTTVDTSSLMDNNAFRKPPSRGFCRRSGRLVAQCGSAVRFTDCR